MLFLIFPLFLMSPVFATSVLNQSEKDGVRRVELDINLDKKIDRIDFYRDGQIFLSEEDEGFGGTLNKKSQYFAFENSQKPIKIVEIDSNRDGKVDRLEKSYAKPDIDQLIITYNVSSKRDGKFDRTWSVLSQLNQKKDDDCGGPSTLTETVSQLNKDVAKLELGIENEFILSVPGYKVHTSCKEKWGHPDFINNLSETMNKGKQCLAELGKKNPDKMNGAALNLQKLNALQAITPVTIACHQTADYSWSGTAGHASTGPQSEIKSLGIKHPYISINPHTPEEKKPSNETVEELKATLFHEQLHNLGIKHGEGIEYPYTCETCCITSDNQEEKEASCRICQGDYSGATDRKYIEDMLTWGEASFESARAQKAISVYLKENPQDRWGVFAMAATNKGSPLSREGYEMALLLESRFKDMTPEEKALIERAKYYDSPSWGQGHAKVLAEAKLDLYLDQSPLKAIEGLKKHKDQLKALLASENKVAEDDKYFASNLVSSMREIIYGIWMNGYPANKSKASTEAYELAREIGFFDKK